MTIEGKNTKNDKDLLSWVRVFVLNELIMHNGKQLKPELIGDITQGIVDKLKERL